MRIITCTGYFSTGSSAVGDLLSEYAGCYCPGDYELRFIYDPDGLADLNYHLVECHNRHNSGHALKRYRKMVDFYCGNRFAPKNEAYFHGHWKEYSYEYLEKLTEFQYRGAWLYDYLDRGVGFHYFNSLLRKVFGKDLLFREMTPCSFPSRKRFLKLTREYLSKLFDAANDKKTPMLIVDQALPPSGTERYVPLFEDIRVIVVDRDPRDVFMLEKYIRKEFVIPVEVEAFCKWYEYTRRHREYEDMDTEYCMFLRFEDLIYDYDNARGRIESFCEIDPGEHRRKKTRFLPEQSIYNTQIWRRLSLTEQQRLEIACIEKRLERFLYPFPEDDVKKSGRRGGYEIC